MKNLVHLIVTTTALFLPFSARAEWSFITLLRGERVPASLECQRVAFFGSAVVKQVSGDARRLCGIDRWEKLAPGARLAPGDLVRTGTEGGVILKMSESESLVRVSSHTILRLVPPTSAADPKAIAEAGEQDGFVVRGCRGAAFYKSDTSAWNPVRVNSVLPEHAMIRAESGARVDLFSTASKRSLRVEGETAVQLGGARAGVRNSADSMVDLPAGRSVASTSRPALAK